MKITKHSKKRVRKRLGINMCGVEKISENAFKYGIKRENLSGSLRRYVDLFYFNHNRIATMIVYYEHVFIFVNNTFVTVYLLPAKYRQAAIKKTRQNILFGEI